MGKRNCTIVKSGTLTRKLHARGTMGLAKLTTIQYLVFGNRQVR